MAEALKRPGGELASRPLHSLYLLIPASSANGDIKDTPKDI